MNIEKDESCVKIQGGIVRGATIEIGNHELPDLLADRAFIHNCDVEILGTAFSIIDANFLNSRIKVRKEISDMRFLEAVFERCTFEGAFVRCSFGHVRGESTTPNAYYRDCNFSSASLDLCSFFEGDLDSIAWPTRPSLVVFNPLQNKDDWLSMEFSTGQKNTQRDIGNQLRSWLAEFEGRYRASQGAPKAVTLDLANYDEKERESIREACRGKVYFQWTS